MKVVVIGGTGLIGSRLVVRLREQGHEAVAAAPNTGVNTLTGEGLAEALQGASVVVDVSNSPSFEDAAAMKFFETSTRNLLAYEGAAGVGHHVALSVVGTDRLSESGYFRAKSAQEKLIKESAISYSIVHATQFFEFLKGLADIGFDGTKVRLPPVLFQPMAADDVASAVCRVALEPPVNGIVEIGGPEQFRLDELVKEFLAATKDSREVIADPDARYSGAKVSLRTLMPDPTARLGATRFATWVRRSAVQAPSRKVEEPNMGRNGAPNIVLVHGGFVDGSGWESVYRKLTQDGFHVSVVQNPTTSLVDDVAATKRVIAEQDGPSVLVGHSYGGAVITEAGNDPSVIGLVYIAAFVPDAGESVSTLIKDPPPGASAPPILPPKDGYLSLDKAKFPASFAGDLDPQHAAFMAESQVPWGVQALTGEVTEPAWKTKPSWYLVSTEDQMIPPAAQRSMSKRAGATVVEEKGSHAIYESKPDAVAALIAKAARSVKRAVA